MIFLKNQGLVDTKGLHSQNSRNAHTHITSNLRHVPSHNVPPSLVYSLARDNWLQEDASVVLLVHHPVLLAVAEKCAEELHRMLHQGPHTTHLNS